MNAETRSWAPAAGGPRRLDGAGPEAVRRSRSVAFSVLLRGALPAAVVTGVAASLVVGVVNGPRAGLSGLVGVAIAVAFFASGLLVVSRVVVDTANPMLFMAVGMAVYFAQVLALLGVLLLATVVDVFDTRAAGIVVLVTVVAWEAAQLRAWRRARVPIYDAVALPETSDHPTTDDRSTS